MKQHMLDRHVDVNLHRVWLDEDNRVATFPLWNLSGEMTSYQAYRPDAVKVQRNDEAGRYYTYRGTKLFPKHCKTVSVWGLESWLLSTVLFVTEGVFDAARLTERGYSAVALLSNDPDSSLLSWLRTVRAMRPVVAVCDPGRAGRKLAKAGHVAHTVEVEGMPDADLGDVSDEYVTRLLAEYA